MDTKINTYKIEKINDKVVETYQLLLKKLSNNYLGMVDYVYPNKDGVQDYEHAGELLYLRSQLYSLAKMCDFINNMISEIVDD